MKKGEHKLPVLKMKEGLSLDSTDIKNDNKRLYVKEFDHLGKINTFFEKHSLLKLRRKNKEFECLMPIK